MASVRRFLSVLVLELKFSGLAVQRLNPEEIQTGFELFWHSFYRFVTDEEGLALPPQSQEFIAIFGAETPYADHAIRAAKSAAAISSWLREWAYKFNLTGREIPHFSIAIHSGETVAMQIPGTDTVPWAVIGEAVTFTRTLVRICRNEEVICSEAFLSAFLGALPPGQEALEIATEEEPDLAGLNWDVADFVPLENHLRNKTILVGKNVRELPDSATVWFSYLYAVTDPKSEATARVIGAYFTGNVPAMETSPSLADSESQFRRLGKYRLLRILGRGGMGSVWLGQDGFGNLAAIKTLLDPLSGEETQIGRFEREAKVMSQLNHRNICRIMEMGEFDGIRFIAMEYVTGVSLADVIDNVPTESTAPTGKSDKQQEADMPSLVRQLQKKKQQESLKRRCRASDPPLPVLRQAHTLALFLKICDAVEFAHGKGILHRDLKPGNVLIREDGDPVVSDFGLAKLRQGQDGADFSHTGQVVGTLAFMAPEQAMSSKEVDECADVFSLGAILYRMLAGADQFKTSGNFAADVQKLQTHEPRPPSSVREGIPEDLDAIVMKALSKEPAARYRSAKALRDDLMRFQSGEQVQARPPSTWDLAGKMYQRHRSVVNTSAAALALIVFLLAFALWRITGERNQALRARDEAEVAKHAAELAKVEADRQRDEAERARADASRMGAQVVDLKSREDRNVENPETPYATTLLNGTESPEEASARLLSQATERMKSLASNPRLRNLVVEGRDDGGTSRFPSEITAELGGITESLAGVGILTPAASASRIAAGWAALLGFDTVRAQEKFIEASRLATGPDEKARIEKLIAATELQSTSDAPEVGTLADRLSSTGNTNDKTVGHLVRALNNAIRWKPEADPSIQDIRSTLAPSPGPRELAALLLEDSPEGKISVKITKGADGSPKLYMNGPDVKSLAPLRDALRRLSLTSPHKAIDIDLSYASVGELPRWVPLLGIAAPNSQLRFLQLSSTIPTKKIDLSNSPFSELRLVLTGGSLRDLRLNGCHLTDPESIFDGRSNASLSTLSHLELAGVRVPSLTGIEKLSSLEFLRFSPELVDDRQSIQSLRLMSSLKFVAVGDGEPIPRDDFLDRFGEPR